MDGTLAQISKISRKSFRFCTSTWTWKVVKMGHSLKTLMKVGTHSCRKRFFHTLSQKEKLCEKLNVIPAELLQRNDTKNIFFTGEKRP